MQLFSLTTGFELGQLTAASAEELESANIMKTATTKVAKAVRR
jgi:hypothetical protein